LDDPVILAATRFSAVMVLLTTAVCYGALIARQVYKKNTGSHTLLATAVTVEMGAAGLHQAYWWLVEMAMARDHCTAADRFRGMVCARAQAIVQYEGITHIFYLFWILGALIVMGLFLSAIDRRFSDLRYLSVLMLISVIGLWLMGYTIAREA
jgi:hypothetical protein